MGTIWKKYLWFRINCIWSFSFYQFYTILFHNFVPQFPIQQNSLTKKGNFKKTSILLKSGKINDFYWMNISLFTRILSCTVNKIEEKIKNCAGKILLDVVEK